MSRYGINYYGLATSTYGGANPVGFIATNFRAIAQTYLLLGERKPRIKLKWDSPTGNWATIRLIRNTYGFPVNAWDGKVLLESVKELDPTQYFDEDLLAGGAFAYYSLFVFQRDTYTWIRAGDATGVSVFPYGNGQRVYDYLPAITKVTQIYTPTIPSENEDLKNFLGVFGFELDYTETLTSLLNNRYNLETVGGQLLPLMLQQFGLSFEPEIGYQQSRILIRDAITATKKKGSSQGFREYMKSFSGWAIPSPIDGTPNPSVEGLTTGHNLMLDYNDSSFEESQGHWLSANSSANLYSLKSKKVTSASLSTNVATFVIGSHNYQIGNQFTISGFYQPLFNVAGVQTITAITATSVSFALIASDVPSLNAFNTITQEYPIIKPYPTPWDEPTTLALSPNKQTGILAIRNASTSSQTIKINCGSDAPITKGIPVQASTSYAFSIYTARGSTARSVTAAIDWYTRQGVYISSTTGAPVTNTSVTFSSSFRPSAVGVSPATAYYAVPTVAVASSAGSASNEFHYFDCAQFEQDTSVTDFDEARQIHLTMKATRINELLNPRFATPLTPWSITGATTSVDNTTAEPDKLSYAVIEKEIDTNVAILTTLYSHQFQTGQEIVVSGVGAPFNGTYSITATTATTIEYGLVNPNIAATSATGTVYYSGNARRLTATGSSVSVTSTTAPADLMPIHYPNTNYIFSVYAKVDSGSKSITPSVSWYDSSKVLINTDTGTVQTVDATGFTWDRISQIVLAPTNAAYASVGFSYSATIGDQVWVDCALFENNVNLIEYFDGFGGPGDSTDFYWEGGTANSARSHFYKNALPLQERIAKKAFTDQLPLGCTIAVYLAQPKT